jgi:hypothetical protein
VAEEIRADADVVDYRHVAHVSMVGDVLDRGLGLRMGLPNTSERRVIRGVASLTPVAFSNSAFQRTCSSPCTQYSEMKFTHDHAAVLRHAREHRIRDVPHARRECKRIFECEKMTGASVTSSASFIVSAETCEMSTSIPSRFISCTTSSPNFVRPPCAARRSPHRPSRCC